MHVDGSVDSRLAQGFANQRTDGEVGDVVIIHHVEVDPVRAGGEYRIHFFPQAGEISGQNRGRNNDRHRRSFTACRAPRVSPRRLLGCAEFSLSPFAPSTPADRWPPVYQDDGGSSGADMPWSLLDR